MDLGNFTLVFCNGEPPSRERIRDLLPQPRLIACADGGANKAASLGYKPDLIVGDLDSFVQAGEAFRKTEIVKISSQDNTDFEKTLNVLLDRGFREFLVVSFSGGRIDQTLANLQIAYEYSKRCKLVLADEKFLIYPVQENVELDVADDATCVSLIPMEDGTCASTSGMKYELDHAFLRKGGQGISNKAKKDRIEVMVHKGGVLVFVGNSNETGSFRK